MTTIAVTKEEIGSDLQYTERGGYKWKGSPKVIKFPAHPLTYPHSDFYMGFAGAADDIVRLSQFFRFPEETKPPRIKDTRGAVLTEEGIIFCWDNYDSWIRVNEPYYAMGSGSHYAIGALATGATVKEAIKVASTKDPFTGFGSKVYSINTH